MHYEIYCWNDGAQVERIMLALTERHRPFVVIVPDEESGKKLEESAGKALPLIMQGERLVGGFSDLINHLRQGSRPRFEFPLGAKGNDWFSQPR